MRCTPRRSLTILLSSLVFSSPATAVIDVEDVAVGADVSRFDGVLTTTTPYDFSVSLEGTGITSVSVQTPNGAVHALTLNDDGWRYAKGDFADLCSMSADPDIGFGTFVFTVGDGTDTENATVSWDPTCTDPHSGYGDITFPTHGQTNVPRSLTITWTCANPPCGNFAWYNELYPIVVPGPDCGDDILDPAATSLTPTCILEPNALYDFWLWSGTLLGGSLQNLSTSPSGDPFTYGAAFDTLNIIQFTTEGDTDTDSDGLVDDIDNCVLVANADQRDTDADSIGNSCDPDVATPNDCVVNFLDLNVYRDNFFQAGDLDTDNNGDGQTNFLDLNIVREFFFGPPGPSAFGCN